MKKEKLLQVVSLMLVACMLVGTALITPTKAEAKKRDYIDFGLRYNEDITSYHQYKTKKTDIKETDKIIITGNDGKEYKPGSTIPLSALKGATYNVEGIGLKKKAYIVDAYPSYNIYVDFSKIKKMNCYNDTVYIEGKIATQNLEKFSLFEYSGMSDFITCQGKKISLFSDTRFKQIKNKNFLYWNYNNKKKKGKANKLTICAREAYNELSVSEKKGYQAFFKIDRSK